MDGDVDEKIWGNDSKENIPEISPDNPWDVETLDEFLYYNCPECDMKCPEKAIFRDHALLNHPKVPIWRFCQF